MSPKLFRGAFRIRRFSLLCPEFIGLWALQPMGATDHLSSDSATVGWARFRQGEFVNLLGSRIFQGALLAVLVVVAPISVRADKPVFVGVAGPAVNLIYAYLAQDTGMWRKYGVDARVILFESGSTLAQVARAGEVSFAINSGPTTIASRTQGADTIIVAATVNTLPYSVVPPKGSPPGISLKAKGSVSAASVRAPTPPCGWWSNVTVWTRPKIW